MSVSIRSVVSASLLLLVVAVPNVSAQSSAWRSDVAAEVNVVHLVDDDDDATSLGIGGRVTVGLSRWVAFDGALTFAPNDDLSYETAAGENETAGMTYNRRRVDGFAGVKVGRAFEKLGLFLKARPGFSTLEDKGVDCTGDVCALMLLVVPEYKTQLVFDLGGIVELYPADRVLARVDVGNTFVRHRSAAPPCTACVTNYLNVSVGVGVRF